MRASEDGQRSQTDENTPRRAPDAVEHAAVDDSQDDDANAEERALEEAGYGFGV